MAVGLRILSAVNTSVASNNAGLTSTQSDYVVILAALFCALVCAVGLAMAARCVCLHRPLNLFMTAPVLHTSAPPPPGLNKKALQLLPTTKYLCEASSNSKQTDCAICLAEFSDGDMMRILPRCGHVFHKTCIDTWLSSHSSCPTCRQLVLVVGKCHHCGGLSAHQGFHGTASEARIRETSMMCRQDYVGTMNFGSISGAGEFCFDLVTNLLIERGREALRLSASLKLLCSYIATLLLRQHVP